MGDQFWPRADDRVHCVGVRLAARNASTGCDNIGIKRHRGLDFAAGHARRVLRDSSFNKFEQLDFADDERGGSERSIAIQPRERRRLYAAFLSQPWAVISFSPQLTRA